MSALGLNNSQKIYESRQLFLPLLVLSVFLCEHRYLGRVQNITRPQPMKDTINHKYQGRINML